MTRRRCGNGLLRDTRGATATEYGLIVSLIVIAMIGAFKGVAGETSSLWDKVSNEVQSNPGV